MTRSLFGGTHNDVVLDTRDRWLKLAEVTLTLWDSPVGGNRYTDLLDHTGAAVSAIRTPGGQVPVFQGPDGVTEMWADDGDNDRHLMLATDAQGIAAIRDETVQAAASVAREQAGGVAGLDSAGKLYPERIPAGFVKAGDLVINVKDYGAVGDGAADDTTKIQAALDAAGNASGGTVLVPRGTYVVSTLTLPSRVHLIGQGGAKLFHKAAATLPCIATTTTATGVLVRDVEIDGNSANQTSNAIGIVIHGTGNRVEGCHVHDVKYDGIYVARGSQHWVVDNRVVRTGRLGIGVGWDAVVPTEYVQIRGNQLDATGENAINLIGEARYIDIVGNTSRNSGGDGVTAYGGNRSNVTVVGNVIQSPYRNGIRLGVDNGVVSGNTITGVITNPGIVIVGSNDDTVTISRVSVTGNVIQTVGNDGIRVALCDMVTIANNIIRNIPGQGITLRRCTDFTITGNSVRDQTGGGSSGIRLTNSQRGTISGNVLREIAGDAIYGEDSSVSPPTIRVTVTGNTVTTAGGWGLRSSGTSDRWLHGSNILQGCTAGPVSLAGTANTLSGANSTA